MYAVIRTGGKQYRVAPGDVVRVEKLAQEDGTVEFTEVLAVSSQTGGSGDGAKLARPDSAKVLATVVQDARAKKVLVFHFKRKKQYKKLQGHRQSYTQVRINEIHVNGESYRAASR
jgi:large subunit ribosomal protein L21